MVDLSVKVAGIELKNPTMTAAGPITRDGLTMKEVAKHGVGCLVAKTMSVKPGSIPRPCVAALKKGTTGLLNTETWSEIPYTQWAEKELKIAKESKVPVIASMGYSAEDLKTLGPVVERAGVDGIEFSLHYVGRDFRPIIEIAKSLRDSVEVPIFAKVSPPIANLEELAVALEKADMDGIVAINTLGPCLAIDVETATPYMASENGYGWISGPAIKPIGVCYTARIARTVKIPVIGCGGIVNGRDAVEYIMAGASAVQILSAAIMRGSSIYGKIAKEIEQFMEEHGYETIEDMRGIALKNLPTATIRVESKPPTLLEDACNGCKVCERVCVYDAITMVEKTRPKHAIPSIDPDKCYGCGMCVSMCPTRALKIDEFLT